MDHQRLGHRMERLGPGAISTGKPNSRRQHILYLAPAHAADRTAIADDLLDPAAHSRTHSIPVPLRGYRPSGTVHRAHLPSRARLPFPARQELPTQAHARDIITHAHARDI